MLNPPGLKFVESMFCNKHTKGKKIIVYLIIDYNFNRLNSYTKLRQKEKTKKNRRFFGAVMDLTYTLRSASDPPFFLPIASEPATGLFQCNAELLIGIAY